MSDLLNSASLVMIPSGYKEDVVYSQIPTDGSGDLSFTRASNGTRVNSAGLVEVTPWNLFGNSEDGTSGKWGNEYNIASVTLNSTTAPNGTNTGNLIVENSGNGPHWFEQSFSAISGTPYTISVYFKAKERTQCVFYGFADNGVFLAQIVIFDLSTGAVVSQSGTQTNSIENVGNGWYRCSMTLTSGASATGYFAYGLANGGNNSYQGNGTSGLYMWGRQLNTGTLKPYFPTTDRLNVPRLTYQNGGGGCPSLLLEKQSTNLLTYSEQFDNAAWSTANANGTITCTANYGISPDGTQNADRIQFTRGSGVSDYAQVYQQVSTTSGTHTFSCWIKSLSGTPSIGWAYNGAVWDVVTLTNEWVRYTWTTTTNTNPSANLIIYGSLATPLSADFLVWGYQIEASSYPTSYIPTTSSSATRVSDACYKTGISSLIGQTEGVLFADVNRIQKSQNYNVAIFIGLWPSVIDVYFDNSNQLICVVYNSGVLQTTLNGSVLANGRHKIAVAYKQNDFVMYVDGTQVATSSSGSVPTCSQLIIGNDDSTLYHLNDSINEAVIFKTRLTNAELASLTTI